jgi:phage shock protein A
MSILNRIGTIIRANVNDLLDGAEDPEKMLDQFIRDMESGVHDAREEVVEAMANEKRMAAQLERLGQEAQDWEGKAETALRAGDEGLARAALVKSEELSRQAEVARQNWERQKEQVAALQGQLKALEDKLQNTKQRRDALLARYQATRAETKVALSGAGMGKAEKALAEYERMEEKILMEADKAQSRAELAAASLDADKRLAEYEKMEAEQRIEERLAALKARLASGEDAGA